MRFGRTLRTSIYGPWKDKYIEYGKLKAMLREDKSDDDDVPWTEDDENRFCDEIFNTQLEKVAQFQEEAFQKLKNRVDGAVEKLKELVPSDAEADGAVLQRNETTLQRLKELEAELDSITNEANELKKYSSLNYTGFLKIAKKHDRKRGDRYKIRPMMQVSLAKRPFNSEKGYSPLLNKLSLLYFAIRQYVDEKAPTETIPMPIDPATQPEMHNGEKYTAHKFWVHPDNLLEVKTYILRRLPALIYSELSAKEADANEDPTVTSLYFDNAKFELYRNKVDRQQGDAVSLRLRWYGQLSQKPELLLEQKSVYENGSSEERKMAIKEKYIKPFLDGEYNMQKTIQKMERRGRSATDIEETRAMANEMQQLVAKHKLEPVLRANYVRTAFQKPGDARVRISIDTNVAFVREDTLDRDRPCRDPGSWHRTDIDSSNMAYPFRNINQSEVSRFPYAVLEIKLKEDNDRKRPSWVEDLMASHLVHPAPRFSKFVHGVASLFEDYVNQLPFWLTDLETDIRKDPQEAFEEEEQRRAQRAEDEMVVGSLVGNKVGSPYKPSKSSPVGKSYLAERLDREMQQRQRTQSGVATDGAGDEAGVGEPPEPLGDEARGERRNYGTLSSVLPGFSLSKYARARRAREQARDTLPPGVAEPTEWIKNAGPLQIEPKVWLANERTFLKWQHICLLLGGLAVSLYSAAGASTGNHALAEAMGIVYILIAVFAGGWGYLMLKERRSMIMQRSGRDFDNMIGPMVVSFALMAALVVNFAIAYKEVFEKLHSDPSPPADGNSTASRFVGELM